MSLLSFFCHFFRTWIVRTVPLLVRIIRSIFSHFSFSGSPFVLFLLLDFQFALIFCCFSFELHSFCKNATNRCFWRVTSGMFTLPHFAWNVLVMRTCLDLICAILRFAFFLCLAHSASVRRRLRHLFRHSKVLALLVLRRLAAVYLQLFRCRSICPNIVCSLEQRENFLCHFAHNASPALSAARFFALNHHGSCSIAFFPSNKTIS